MDGKNSVRCATKYSTEHRISCSTCFARKTIGTFCVAVIGSANFGVHEYLVVLDAEPVGLLWHRLDAGCYRLVEPDEDGIIRSHALPNLWFPLKAVQNRDWWAVLGCIERG